jgi:hypothetical protein
MKAVIIARVSTEEQKEAGLSLPVFAKASSGYASFFRSSWYFVKLSSKRFACPAKF